MATLGCFAVVLALLSLVPASLSGPGEDEAIRSSKLLINGVAGLMTVVLSKQELANIVFYSINYNFNNKPA